MKAGPGITINGLSMSITVKDLLPENNVHQPSCHTVNLASEEGKAEIKELSLMQEGLGSNRVSI